MLLAGNLLRDGPSPHVAPAWIQWVRAPNAPDAVSADNGDVPVVIEEEEEEWVPYLQPRRKRGRGSADGDGGGGAGGDGGGGADGDGACVEDNDGSGSETPEEPDVFPYPVGTCVARDFRVDGMFKGVIHQHYDDDPNICKVRYTDGDHEDMDKEEVSYAIDLYKREFILKEAD